MLRRPSWTASTTAEELHQKEKELFLEWRRSLAALQEENGVLLTPYEKNLEFWRQLWRVVEKSDVVVQIVDARNPLLFRCEDLEKYVIEVSENKMNLILINKADFLTEKQRQCWADHFSSINVRVAFFSAKLAADENTETKQEDGGANITRVENEIQALENAVSESAEKLETNEEEGGTNITRVKNEIQALEQAVNESAEKLAAITQQIEKTLQLKKETETEMNDSSKLLSRDGLIEVFRSIHRRQKVTQNITTIGLVGYPNVGKSSTINALLSAKKVSVSATPGKTKHFQTLYLTEDVLLCDCPGLVMPSFVFTKAEMIVNGILPIDQMRDHVPPVNLVATLIPKRVIEDTYGIMIPSPMEGEDPDRPPFAEEILNAYACKLL